MQKLSQIALMFSRTHALMCIVNGGQMDEKRFNEMVQVLLLGHWDEDYDEHCGRAITCVDTYDEAGVLTNNAGLVVELTDGSEFQITIVRSKP